MVGIMIKMLLPLLDIPLINILMKRIRELLSSDRISLIIMGYLICMGMSGSFALMQTILLSPEVLTLLVPWISRRVDDNFVVVRGILMVGDMHMK